MIKFNFYKLTKILTVLLLVATVFSPLLVSAQSTSEDSGPQPTTGTDASPPASDTAAADNAAAAQSSSSSGGCGWNIFTYACAVSMASRLVALWLSLVSWLLYFAGKLMDVSIALSITNGAFRADNVALISVGWPIVRDFASLFIVLAMLVISIATILRLESYSYKTALPKLILVALLISFSLPVGQFVIDASNVIAVGLYNKTGATGRTDVSSGTTIGGVAIGVPNDISGVFARGLSISRVYEFDESGELVGPEAATMTGILISGIMGSIVIMIAAFVLAAFAMLFIARTVMLWMLLVFSPAAFAASIFPSTAQYAKQWWTMLLSQSFFAPVGLFMIYLVAAIIDPNAPGGGFLGKALEHSAGQSGFYSAFTTNVQLIMQYIVLIFLLWYSLTLAQKMGAVGASHAVSTGTKWGSAVKGVVKGVATRRAQRMVGSAVNGALLNNRVGQALVGNRVSSALGITHAVLSQSTKAKEAREHTAKQEAELMKGLSPREQARMLSSMSSPAALRAHEALSDDDRAKVAEEMHKNNSLETFSNTLRTAAQRDPKNYNEGKVMENFARAALPHNTQVALAATNPGLFGQGMPQFDATAPGYDAAKAQQASATIAKLMNKIKNPDQRADVFTNKTNGVANGADTGNMGKFMRQYFAQNGTLNDINKNADALAVGNQMLEQIVDAAGSSMTTIRAQARAAVTAEFAAKNVANAANARNANRPIPPPINFTREDIDREERKQLASTLRRNPSTRNLADQMSGAMSQVFMDPTSVAVRSPS